MAKKLFLAIYLFGLGLLLDGLKKLHSRRIDFRLKHDKSLSDKFSVFLSRKIKYFSTKWENAEKKFNNL